jgi:hypothetical protein
MPGVSGGGLANLFSLSLGQAMPSFFKNTVSVPFKRTNESVNEENNNNKKVRPVQRLKYSICTTRTVESRPRNKTAWEVEIAGVLRAVE